VCGICGVVTVNGAPDPAVIDAMRAALVHRGPDEGSTEDHEVIELGLGLPDSLKVLFMLELWLRTHIEGSA
jgi:hypothetical protein